MILESPTPFLLMASAAASVPPSLFPTSSCIALSSNISAAYGMNTEVAIKSAPSHFVTDGTLQLELCLKERRSRRSGSDIAMDDTRSQHSLFFVPLLQWEELFSDETRPENHTYSKSTLMCSINIPRGGSMDQRLDNKTDAPSSLSEPDEKFISTQQMKMHDDLSLVHSTSKQDLSPEERSWMSPRRLWSSARKAIGRTTGIFGFNRNKQTSEDTKLDSTEDHEFAELDSILEKSKKSEQQKENQRRIDETKWLVSPPEEASMLKGWNRRSLRAWMNKMEHKFLSNETALALKTIRKILESFPDYGVVDLLGLYSPKDVILSIISLSRLQRVVEYCNGRNSSDEDAKVNSTPCVDNSISRETLDDLAHYATFANAAYGWKGLAAFCGRFHFGGDNRALVKRTGIHRRDIIMTNWHSKTNRPAFFLVRDVERKTLVLSIRGTLSPRDILTDLCASCENFFVEDKSDFIEIGDVDGEKDSLSMVSTPSPIMVGRAHKGMVDAAKAVARLTGKIISDELRSKKDYSLVVVGHSLGGGVAATLTTMWRRRFAGRIRCCGYGMPCVSPLSDGQDEILSVIGEGDPFSVISLGHLADTTKALSHLCQDKGFRDEILQRTHFGKLTSLKDIPESDLIFSMNAMDCLRKQMRSEKLYPPGTIYIIAGSLFYFNIEMLNGNQAKDVGKIRRVDSSQFNELKLHARMFDLSYHIPARYEAILDRLLSSKSDL